MNAESELLARANKLLSDAVFGQLICRSGSSTALGEPTFDANAPPQTESELIAAWWRRGGYDER